jgi:hypothetical protein
MVVGVRVYEISNSTLVVEVQKCCRGLLRRGTNGAAKRDDDELDCQQRRLVGSETSPSTPLLR